MLTTTQAFEKFRQRLELSDTEQRDAARRQKDVRECIRSDFELTKDFLSGSYSRHTKAKPLKDVDVMFVLGQKERWRRDKPPIDTLQAFEKSLKKEYTEQGQVEIGRRSVTVEFEKNYYPEEHEGKVLSIDAVPAFESGNNEYEIPDKLTATWIKTNPETHQERATAKNKELGGRWVPLVKMAKGWNRANGKPVRPSFLIEVAATDLVEAPFSNYPDEIRNLFAALEASIGQSWSDPAGLGPSVSDQMTAQFVVAARKALQEAQRKATLARRAEETGREGEALRLWREILGDYFPLS
ncbi:MAG TPA: CBASS oligonucleotide cyclase [bacterium]|nr:CBASS oligonucleotide cyclase [bacterium]